MTTQASPAPLHPLTADQLARLQAATHDFSALQLAWLSGYFWGQSDQSVGRAAVEAVPPTTAALTIISASQTGNARRLAEQLRDDFLAAQQNVRLVNAGEYKFKQIAGEKLLIIIISTQGEGEPPEEALALHKFLLSKKAPAMTESAYAVFALGDSSYPLFCQAGKEVDDALSRLGAARLLPRTDADVDYTAEAENWRQQIVSLLKARLPAATPETAASAVIGSVDLLDSSPYSKLQPLTATLAVNQKITGRGSDKDIRHIEIDVGDSGLRYQPGDALGVWYENDSALAEELLQLLGLQGQEGVTINGNLLPLSEALLKHLELTVNTANIVAQYAKFSANDTLLALLSDKQKLQDYAHSTPIVDMVRRAPAKLQAAELTQLLRPLTPRLYSIASSQAENATEIHLTVAAVRYDIDGRLRSGGASGYLVDRLSEEAEVRVFIEYNNHFRLPADPEAPVIMIGPGTGIAPFRAFMQQRDNDAARGKNWLFFGNPHFSEDFLYQVEWQRYVKQGLLTRIDVAWSRDQQHKIYVQDKLRTQGAEVWRWLQQGAYLYVCGDASRMAKDVEQALLEVIAGYGAMDTEAAEDYLSELRMARRYQRDVY